jgi:hypothetical protein
MTTFEVVVALDQIGLYRMYGLEVQLWNFLFTMPLPKEIRLEVYDESSEYIIECPEELII